MQRVIFFVVLLLISAQMSGQLTIKECYEKANQNYPLAKQYGLIEKSEVYNISNAKKGMLPQVSISAKASYQSEVVNLPISIPGVSIDPLSKDQYKVAVDIDQTIWDGGVIKTKQEMSSASAEITRKGLEVDLYMLKERVNQLFFGIFILQEQLVLNQVMQNQWGTIYDFTTSQVKNGVANNTDLNRVKVEQANTIQREIQLRYTKQAYMDMLSTLIGATINESTYLMKPSSILSTDAPSMLRPEIDLFNAKNDLLNLQIESIKAVNKPKLGLFFQGGYGRPAFNMLSNEFEPYYIGGVKFSWRLSGLYTKKNDINIINIKNNENDIHKQTFMFNSYISSQKEDKEIKKIRELIDSDNNIIELRKSIKQSTKTKVENGVATITDYIREVNAEDMSVQQKAIHEVELLYTIHRRQFITNEDFSK